MCHTRSTVGRMINYCYNVLYNILKYELCNEVASVVDYVYYWLEVYEWLVNNIQGFAISVWFEVTIQDVNVN